MDERIQLGGEAANTANALARWGTEVILTGNALGDGVNGTQLRAMLAASNLDAKVAGIPPEVVRTPVCDIYITPDGERTMFGMGFSEMEPTIAADTISLRPGEWFTAEPNMEVASRKAIRLAQEAGMRTYLMDFFRDDDPVTPASTWQSSTDWVGHRGNAQRNVRWVNDFVARKGCYAILSDGPNGFVAGAPGQPARLYPPFPAVSVVDSTGAGDTFRAGMLYGLDQDWPMGKCLAFAAAAGCLECAYIGATTQVPTVAEIEAHITDNSDVARYYV